MILDSVIFFNSLTQMEALGWVPVDQYEETYITEALNEGLKLNLNVWNGRVYAFDGTDEVWIAEMTDSRRI